MMKKKTVRLISGVIAAVLVVAMLVSMFASGIVFAAAADDEDADSLQSKLDSLEEEKAAVQERIADLTAQANDVQATRDALQQEIDLTKEEIATVEAYIERLQEQIDVKTTELEAAEKALEEKEELFAQTVRTTYEQGEISYLEVLLNSSSFSDLLTRLEIVSAIMEDNQKVVDEYTAAKEDIEQKRDDLQDTQDEQKNYQENLNYKVDDLAASEAQQAALQESLEAYKAESEAEYDRIESEMQDVSNQIAELSRQAAANGSVPMGDGTLIWPTPSCTTTNSAYGYRVHPIYGTVKFHAGEDIPAGYGAEILAAASGTVVTAGWVSGYGNYTVIDHGGGLMTAYGHQSSFAVSVGDVVTQGQVIGYVGSTGNSTGPHLHFEVYVNGATVDPKSYF
ncbi:MAG TPA: peptidoglycan DD-metalloendopeptidase family protein [Candidatus Agathobaculum stercoravium]|nr:M23 family metallopeptidase [uncultured Agathobaculum sp.]HIV98121.1 peptidoglycan DD-metalloendopeptidase family protein [Candidatus Agathobaculum stercoravium]